MLRCICNEFVVRASRCPGYGQRRARLQAVLGNDDRAALYRARAFSGLRQRVPGHGWRRIGLHLAGTGDAAAQKSGAQAAEDTFDANGGKPRPVHIAFADDLLTTQGLQELMQQFILPRGFPTTVTENYMTYVRWTALGLLSGRVQSVLATQAALFAVGLGAGAIPMAAAVQWVLKDGVGHAAAICYAGAVNTRFDADAKRYRMHSTVALTVADFISIVMPLYPQHFLFLASLSSAMGSMANIAQLASRARVQASFALAGNLADCARAGQTQAKLMGLLGTSLGAGVSWIIGPNPLMVATCMMPLAALSLYSTYASSCVVVLNSFSVQRAERAFKHIIERLEKRNWCLGTAQQAGAANIGCAPTPSEIAQEETFFRLQDAPLFRTRLLLQPLLGSAPGGIQGVLVRVAGASDRVDIRATAQLLVDGDTRGADAFCQHQSESHMWSAAWHDGLAYATAVRIGVPRANAGSIDMSSLDAPLVAVWHRSGATGRTKLQAMWHACVLRSALDEFVGCSMAPAAADFQVLLGGLHTRALSSWPLVLADLEDQSWAVDRVFMDGAGCSLDPWDNDVANSHDQ